MESTKASEVLPFKLRAVYFRDSQLRMNDAFDPLVGGQRLTGQLRTSKRYVICQELDHPDGQPRSLQSCAFVTRFEFRYGRQPEKSAGDGDTVSDENLIAEIYAEIAVDYLYQGEGVLAEESLRAWEASDTPLFQAWPYWREYCHASLMRMNLPVVVVPMIAFAGAGFQEGDKRPLADKNIDKKPRKSLAGKAKK